MGVLFPLIFGIITGYNFHFKIVLYCASLIAIVTFTSTIHSIIKKEGSILAVHLLFYALGLILIHQYLKVPQTNNHISYYCDKGKYEICGVVVNSSEKLGGITLVAGDITLNGLKVKGLLKLTIIGEKKSVVKGNRIKFRSKIKSIRNFSNPNAFNYKRFIYFQNIYGRSYINSSKIEITKSEIGLIDKARSNIRSIIEKSSGNNSSKSILRALITGDKKIKQELRDIFNRTGTGHILAVSGLHMGIIASFIFMVARYLMSFVKPVLWSGNLRRYSAIFIVPGVIFFGLISGMSPSTQRAILMVLCFVITLLIKKELDMVNTIAIAALIIIIIFPPALFSISFQLSFSAVIFIILFLRLDLKRATNRNLINRSITFFMVTVFATLGTLPLVMFYFNNISLISFVANIIVVPVFSFIIIPLGLFVILFVAINSFLAEFVVEITLYILKIVIAVIEFFSNLNFAAISTFKPTLFELFLYYAIFCSIFLIIKGGSFKRYRFLAIALSLLLLTDTAYWINQRYLRDDVRITFLDVGQGSASLIELPNGKTVLIDGGGYSNNIYFDMGKIVIAPFLLSKKIFTIDTLILSHANSDHLNGLIYIAKNFNVKSLWSNGEASDTLSYGDLIKTVKKRKIIHEICSGYQKREMERVLFEVLYPGKNFKNASEKWRDSNNNSLTIRVSFGETSILFPGDIEHQAERELIGLSKSKLKSSILLVPHHGSKTSSSKGFINCVMPEIAIISSGYKNRYGFPDIKTVKRIKDKNIKIIRVDQRGSVIFDINKEDYRYRFYNNN